MGKTKDSASGQTFGSQGATTHAAEEINLLARGEVA
jgi:hypothetical protein